MKKNRCFALSTAERVQYSRPAIDVLFETAADVYRRGLLGIILPGANSDGTKGASRIRQTGGIALAPSPETPQVPVMPRSAIDDGVDAELDLSRIAPFINRLIPSLDEGRPDGTTLYSDS